MIQNIGKAAVASAVAVRGQMLLGMSHGCGCFSKLE